MSTIAIGRLLRASTAGCVVGCRVSEIDAPVFGSMVRIPLNDRQEREVIGLIYDIHIDDDGLVRQLVTATQVSQEVIEDNRLNRNVPLEISVLFIGYFQQKNVYHLLPPRPPLTLDVIYACSPADILLFTGAGRFGYFRHILKAVELPVGDLLAAHILQASQVQSQSSQAAWTHSAVQEVITLLRDDYPTLMNVLGALADTRIDF
jgi:hypothetical protein